MIHRRHLVTFDGRTTVLPTAVSSVALFFTLGFSVAKADLTFKAGEKSLGEAGIQADGYDVAW